MSILDPVWGKKENDGSKEDDDSNEKGFVILWGLLLYIKCMSLF